MSVSDTGGGIAITGSDRPLIEPDAICEGCGKHGTVGRAGRDDTTHSLREEHRFCAECWPEWSAFYEARWREQTRRAMEAWLDSAAEGRAAPRPSATGTWFESATWHGVIKFIDKLTLQARYYRDPPAREMLARYASEIRGLAPTRVGPMPREVRAFIAEYGGDDS